MAIPSLFILGVQEKDARAAADAARHLGLSVTAAEYKPATIDAIERSGASVVMADLAALPGGGEILCRQIARLSRPVLLLAAVADSAGAASALKAGATVCLTHPLSPAWLAAQLSSLVRLLKAKENVWSANAPVTIRGLRIDPGRCEASAGDRAIPLTPTEFRILACLARSPGIVVSGRDLAEEALDLRLPEQEAMELLKVHVYRLRRKLAGSGIEPSLLRNVRGFGYMLERRAQAVKPPRAVAAPLPQRRSA